MVNIEPIAKVTCGNTFSLCLSVNGKVFGWGVNDKG